MGTVDTRDIMGCMEGYIEVRVSPIVRSMLAGTELFSDPDRETDAAALELRAAVLASGPRQVLRLSPMAAGHLADYVDVALLAAMDDGDLGVAAERAAYRRTLGVLIEQGVSPV